MKEVLNNYILDTVQCKMLCGKSNGLDRLCANFKRIKYAIECFFFLLCSQKNYKVVN